MVTITAIDRDGNEHKLEAQEGAPLMETLRDNDVGVEAICGGCCSCATCHCYLDEESFDRVNAAQPEEEELLDTLDYREKRSRLTCQITVGPACEGMVVTVAPAE